METSKRPQTKHTAILLSNVQQELQVLFTSVSEAIFLIEPNGTILVVNDVGARWLGQNAEALSGQNLFPFLTPYGVPIREWVHKAISLQSIVESDNQFEKRYIHTRLIPISGGRKVTRLIIIGQDITDHRRAEEQVREFTDQMERKVRERTKELEALNRKLIEDKRRSEIRASLSQHLMQDTRDYSYLLEHVTTEISNLVGDTCLIALFTSDLTQMVVQAITDRDVDNLSRLREQLLGRAISVETNAIASKILNGERYSASGISKEQGFELLPVEFAALLGNDGLSVLEVFPLHAGEQPLGMLAISREYGHPYTEDEISFIGSLISPIALAIQNARLFDQLNDSQNQLRGLSQQLVQMQEAQYRYLAQELHDRIGQDMTAINININIMRAMLPQTISKEVISRLADTEKLVKESVAHMRSIMAEFRPPMLDRYGLTAALNWYSEQYTQRTHIVVNVDDQYLKAERLPSEIEIALFRISQEALTNVVKHAKASRVVIELLESQGNILMTVTDNGVGFDVKKKGVNSPGHWGVTNMQERARAINGKFLLRSVPGQGTQIVVRVRKAK